MDMKESMYIDNISPHLQALLHPYRGKCPDDLTDSDIMGYADAQAQHFADMLTGFNPDVRRDECYMYFLVWQHIRAQSGQWDKLNVYQRGQVMDCYYDEAGINADEDQECHDVIPF